MKSKLFPNITLSSDGYSFPNNSKSYQNLVTLLRDWAETDTYIREQAVKVLSSYSVYGDSEGVPTLEDIVDLLVQKIQDIEYKLNFGNKHTPFTLGDK